MTKGKKHKVSIIGCDFTLEVWEMQKLLTDRAYRLATKIMRQGGELNFGVSSIKPELLSQYE